MSSKTSVYLDYNATTPVDPEVCEVMMSCMDGSLGNPSSIHGYGQKARRIIDDARKKVADLIGAQPEEIFFTSGGTEANNLALLGGVSTLGIDSSHVITTAIEHQAVLNPCRHIEKLGGAVTYLPVGAEGCVDPQDLFAALKQENALVSIMLANNDVGVIQPIRSFSRELRDRGVLFHTDAVQAAGKIPVDVDSLGVDLLSFSSHKLHGPQGVGALYVRRGVSLKPLMYGGHQERNLRPGTENLPAIAGFGKACELAAHRMESDAAYLEKLRSFFEASILQRLPGAVVNAGGVPRLPNTSSIRFRGISGESLVINLDILGVAASTGAACSSADHAPSHVLTAMGCSPEEAASSVRFSFGRGNTEDEVAHAVDLVVQAVEMLSGGFR
jgi:cysteine desulfurase